MTSTTQKPTRVITAEVHVCNCPICGGVIAGTVATEVYVDGITATAVEEMDGTTSSVTAAADVRTRIRGMEMPAHRCLTSREEG